jgi:hypothetical protein
LTFGDFTAKYAEFAESFEENFLNLRVLSGLLWPFWQQTKAAGQTTKIDPFQLILDIQHPQCILGDWQHLPAAREAINRFVLNESIGD